MALLQDCIVNWLVHRSSGNPIYKMERLWQRPHDNEIPIFGSSRAQSNIVPSMIGTNCFNYGFDGMGMAETLFNMRANCEKHSPCPVILNFDPWAVFSVSPKIWRGDYRLAPNSGRASLLDSIVGIRFYGMLRGALSNYLNSECSVTKVVDNGAVLLKHSRSAEEWRIINSKIEPACFSYSDDANGERVSEGGLRDVIRSLAPRKVIIVVCPCTSTWRDNFTLIEDLDRYLKLLNTMPNVIVVNFFSCTQFTDADFVDPTHLNIIGARKLTGLLMQQANLK